MKLLVTFNKIVWLLILGIALNVGYIGYLKLYPFQTVTYNKLPWPVKNSPVKAGEPLIYTVDYCRYTTLDAHFTRTLVGQTVITFPEQNSNIAPGCRVIDVKNTTIPSYVPPGTYHLELSVCFKFNPIRQICHYPKTEDFEVVQ